jgi:putative addiction module killer protein
VRVAEYVTNSGHSPFSEWYDDLDPVVAIKVTSALVRIRNGNTSNLKGVGRGVHEWRIDTGPGYRIYVGRDGDEIVVLLGGGTKRRQQADIESATGCWLDYKTRRRFMWR